MKVLLIATNQYMSPYPVYPIGLDYVRGALEPEHQVQVEDLCLAGDEAPSRLAGAINEFQPDVVGLALRNIDNVDAAAPLDFIDSYRRIAADIRACTSAPLLLGGSAFNILPRELMETTGADFGILGEGERLALLLAALEDGGDPGRVQGVLSLGAEPVFPGPWSGKINRAFDPGHPGVAFYLKHGGMLNIQTKRGCPFECLYCTYPLIEGRKQRLFDPQEAAAQAMTLQEAGARFLFVADSSFNSSVEHSLAVAEAFAKRGVVIPWGAYFTPISMPADYYQRLKDCGLSHVEFGTDSLSDALLSPYGKPFSASDVLASHREASKAGLHVAHYFLLGGPGENAGTLMETLDNAEKLDRGVLFFFCGMRIYPHTGIHSIAVAEKQIGPTESCLAPRFYRPGEISLAEIADLVRARARKRLHWVIGGGDDKLNRAIVRLHRHGHAGPLWEKLLW